MEKIKQDIQARLEGEGQFKELLNDFYRTGEWQKQDNPEADKASISFLTDITAIVEKHSSPAAAPTASFADRLKPLTEGLFSVVDSQKVLDFLCTSVIVLNKDNIQQELAAQFVGEAADLAALYISALAPGLDLPFIKGSKYGRNIGQRIFLSPAYFSTQDDLADFLLHEAGHILYSARQDEAGTGSGDGALVEVSFEKRDIFAYAIEYYGSISRLIAQGNDKAGLLVRLDAEMIQVEDPDTVRSLVREALESDQGWQHIAAAVK